MTYNSKNRTKYELYAHIIFSTKYRKNILTGDLDIDLKNKIKDISRASRFEVIEVETDLNHIHILISYEPNISLSQIIRKLKSESTYFIWSKYGDQLRKIYWKKKNIWTPAYFCTSVGSVSKDKINEYIKNQG